MWNCSRRSLPGDLRLYRPRSSAYRRVPFRPLLLALVREERPRLRFVPFVPLFLSRLEVSLPATRTSSDAISMAIDRVTIVSPPRVERPQWCGPPDPDRHPKVYSVIKNTHHKTGVGFVWFKLRTEEQSPSGPNKGNATSSPAFWVIIDGEIHLPVV